MSVGREAIWTAFFGLFFPSLTVPGGGPFKIVSRRLRHYDDVLPGSQPALYVLQNHETAEARDRGLPTKWTLRGELFIYARNEPSGLDQGGGSVLNPLIDAVETALFPVPAHGNVQSLGGLVSRAFIDGEVEVYEGNLDNQAVAIIPVRIITPV